MVSALFTSTASDSGSTTRAAPPRSWSCVDKTRPPRCGRVIVTQSRGPCSQRGGHRLRDFTQVERLDQQPDRTVLNRPPGDLLVARDENYRHAVPLPVEAAEDFVARHSRHVHIKKDHVRL